MTRIIRPPRIIAKVTSQVKIDGTDPALDAVFVVVDPCDEVVGCEGCVDGCVGCAGCITGCPGALFAGLGVTPMGRPGCTVVGVVGVVGVVEFVGVVGADDVAGVVELAGGVIRSNALPPVPPP